MGHYCTLQILNKRISDNVQYKRFIIDSCTNKSDIFDSIEIRNISKVLVTLKLVKTYEYIFDIKVFFIINMFYMFSV